MPFSKEWKGGNMRKVYYAHSINDYGTEKEKRELDNIYRHFNDTVLVVNPNGCVPQNREEKDIMEMCFNIVANCNYLVFSALDDDGTIGLGVYNEIELALSFYMPVYYMANENCFIRVDECDFSEFDIIWKEGTSRRKYARVRFDG